MSRYLIAQLCWLMLPLMCAAQVAETAKHAVEVVQPTESSQAEHNEPISHGEHRDHPRHGESMNHGEHRDHDSHDESMSNVEQMDHASDAESMKHDRHMDHPGHGESVAGSTDCDSGLRDPHAYSNGYERGVGPYALESGDRVRLADERTYMGLWIDRAEWVEHDEEQGHEIEGYAWIGDSYRRFILQTQIETVEGEIEEGEIDLFYSQALSAFWDVRGGLHHAFGENANSEWAAIGVKGLAPYWFELEANLHVGSGGRTALDLEAEYDLLLSQRLILQPRLDLAAFSETDTRLRQGSGLSAVKVGARLRYEFSRQFAPYLGFERVRRFGETADLLPAGFEASETHWVFGLKFWL